MGYLVVIIVVVAKYIIKNHPGGGSSSALKWIGILILKKHANFNFYAFLRNQEGGPGRFGYETEASRYRFAGVFRRKKKCNSNFVL